jgi:hypothetical protein
VLHAYPDSDVPTKEDVLANRASQPAVELSTSIGLSDEEAVVLRRLQNLDEQELSEDQKELVQDCKAVLALQSWRAVQNAWGRVMRSATKKFSLLWVKDLRITVMRMSIALFQVC